MKFHGETQGLGALFRPGSAAVGETEIADGADGRYLLGVAALGRGPVPSNPTEVAGSLHQAAQP